MNVKERAAGGPAALKGLFVEGNLWRSECKLL